MSEPTRPQLAAAIREANKARRETWPSSAVWMDADIPPRTLLAWVSQWGKAREGWIETVADAVEKFGLVADAQELEAIVRDLIETRSRSANDFQVEMMKLLPPDEWPSVELGGTL